MVNIPGGIGVHGIQHLVLYGPEARGAHVLETTLSFVGVLANDRINVYHAWRIPERILCFRQEAAIRFAAAWAGRNASTALREPDADAKYANCIPERNGSSTIRRGRSAAFGGQRPLRNLRTEPPGGVVEEEGLGNVGAVVTGAAGSPGGSGKASSQSKTATCTVRHMWVSQ